MLAVSPALWLFVLSLAACRSSLPGPSMPSLEQQLGIPVLRPLALTAGLGTPLPYPGYSVTPVLLGGADYQVSAALWLPQGPGPHPAVLMAHGHFGQGKASGEAQGPAHVFAHNGYAVLVVDTPGVEEGARAERQIHFQAGGSNRMLLAAHGSSAMALQLRGLQAGLDYLESRPDIGALALSGASGGAVQALYLSLVDARAVALVLASPVDIPHRAEQGGCLCDLVPGLLLGSDSLLSKLDVPSLWMVELPRARPAGLPASARWSVVPGPHGYEPAMIQQALDFLAPILGGGQELPLPLLNTPEELLAGPSPQGGVLALLRHARASAPLPPTLELPVDCAPGAGLKVAVLGIDEPRLPQGYRVCRLALEQPGIEAAALFGRGDGAGSVARALAASGVRAVLAQGAYGPAAVRSGLPYAVVQMPQGPEGLPWYAAEPGGWPGQCAGCVQSLEQARILARSWR